MLHVAIPGAIAKVCFTREFIRAWLIMLATMLVDLDHFLANPVYDPGRCSIGYHPLHQYPLILLYGLFGLWPKTRLIGVGLVIHMLLDGLDCAWIRYEN
jgi:hypothetical protein